MKSIHWKAHNCIDDNGEIVSIHSMCFPFSSNGERLACHCWTIGEDYDWYVTVWIEGKSQLFFKCLLDSCLANAQEVATLFMDDYIRNCQ